MSKVIARSETFVRTKLSYACNIGSSQKPFGSLLYVATRVILKIQMDYLGEEFYTFDCFIENLRGEKLHCNYSMDLTVEEKNEGPLIIASKTRNGLELAGNKQFYIGFDKICLDYFNPNDLNDRLTLTLRITFEDIQTPDVEPQPPINSAWLNKFSCLYLEENFKDLTFKIGKEELMAHRLVLVDRSKVFRAMLQHDTKERRDGVIEIEDCKVESFRAFLKYLYIDEIENIENNAVDLLILAEKYNVECLKSKCEDYLRGITDKKNAISHLIAAYLSNSALLKATALFKIKPCVEEILKSQDARLLNDYPQLFREIMLIFDS